MIQNAFTLSANEIYQTLANMIISQEVFADNFGKHQTLVDRARVDGSLLGDRKLYYACQALETHDWLGDNEAGNLLALDRAADPAVQAIILDVKKQIRLTTDAYLSKRAWSTEGAFNSFTAVMMGLMGETKKIEEGTSYNVFIGTTKAERDTQNRSIVIEQGKEGQSIAKGIADILVEMGDYSKDFNDYGYLRSYSDESIKVIWNSAAVNEIKKVDTPTIFHRDGLVDKLDEITLPAKYFGRAVTSNDLESSGVAKEGVVIRAAKEIVLGNGENRKHYFAGEKFPSATTFGTSKDVALADAYVEDASILCKIVTVLPPVMSAFEVGTAFFNPRSLTTNNYVTYMRNTYQALKNYPFITVSKAE